jgi:hypothetical protein
MNGDAQASPESRGAEPMQFRFRPLHARGATPGDAGKGRSRAPVGETLGKPAEDGWQLIGRDGGQDHGIK